MVNASPIGRKCSQTQRDEFYKFDNVGLQCDSLLTIQQEHKVREKLVKTLEEKFKGWNLKFSIGGQISIDIFPGECILLIFVFNSYDDIVGWDKTFCLQYVKHFEKIYFFGDKTEPVRHSFAMLK
jgi:phosphomannomutase